MVPVLFALLPVFAAIALGHVLKRLNFLSDEGWAAFDRMNYYVFFPALIIHAIATADLSGEMVMRVGAVLLGGVFTVAAALALARPILTISSASFSSLFQCCIRWNGFVALASALTLLGPEGVSLVAIPALSFSTTMFKGNKCYVSPHAMCRHVRVASKTTTRLAPASL